MANTLKKISTVTVGSGGAASIDFDNIPQTYTDLKVVVSLRTGADNVTAELAINGVKTNMTQRFVQGSGSAASSSNNTAINILENQSSTTASVFSNSEIYIPNYTSANYKSISIDTVSENNATAAYQRLTAGLWSSTAAITRLTIDCAAAGTLQQYSTATLYGISNANTTVGGSGKATGGNQVYTDGSYWYHVFTSDGNFVPSTSMNVDYLVVAGGGGGGGGGGSNVGSGAGAGGLRCTVGATGGGGSLESALSVTAQTYSITVGGGGAGAGANNTGTKGSDSIFSTITSTGGGGGGSQSSAPGTGGSGGGATVNYALAAGTANQGYGGGTASATTRAVGGGGGASAAGGNHSGSQSGAGGNGATTSISGTSTTYAGGGGGGGTSGGQATRGLGGSGGGGNGGPVNTAGSAGTTNTGGGGGGGGGDSVFTGGAGGSGIVIVRYAA